jgi:AcrR family transcriptional regulator
MTAGQDHLDETVEACGRRRGRPMNADLDLTILRATIELLGERGFDGFTVQDIAERAGAGLGAIYRRWPTKLDVVVAAVRLLSERAPEIAPTGDVEADLTRALISRVSELGGCLGAVLPGLVGAMRENPELAALVHETAVGPKLDAFRAILAPAFSDPAELALRAEIALGMPLYRVLFTGSLPTAREIRTRIVPLILGRVPASAGSH